MGQICTRFSTLQTDLEFGSVRHSRQYEYEVTGQNTGDLQLQKIRPTDRTSRGQNIIQADSCKDKLLRARCCHTLYHSLFVHHYLEGKSMGERVDGGRCLEGQDGYRYYVHRLHPHLPTSYSHPHPHPYPYLYTHHTQTLGWVGVILEKARLSNPHSHHQEKRAAYCFFMFSFANIENFLRRCLKIN